MQNRIDLPLKNIVSIINTNVEDHPIRIIFHERIIIWPEILDAIKIIVITLAQLQNTVLQTSLVSLNENVPQFSIFTIKIKEKLIVNEMFNLCIIVVEIEVCIGNDHTKSGTINELGYCFRVLA